MDLHGCLHSQLYSQLHSQLHLCFLASELVSQLPTGDDLLLLAPDGVLQVALLAVIPAAGASSMKKAAKGCVGPPDKEWS